MTDLQQKLAALVILLLVVAGLLGLGYHLGDKAATEKYLPKIAELNTKIDAADQRAKEDQAKYQENAHAIKDQADSDIARIRAYYQRLLQSVSSQAGSSPTAAGSQGADGTSGQQTITGCRAEFEQACVLDAERLTRWQEYAIRNGIPVCDPCEVGK